MGVATLGSSSGAENYARTRARLASRLWQASFIAAMRAAARTLGRSAQTHLLAKSPPCAAPHAPVGARARLRGPTRRGSPIGLGMTDDYLLGLARPPDPIDFGSPPYLYSAGPEAICMAWHGHMKAFAPNWTPS